ncbi:MAG TPA: 4-hydroxy-tetrahydrodipicolinate reductase, partial [Candidatus Dormibacteraeota bacterium]|nr:4-hydroxy-tetrahydrodipicolinate reductase [Candidatus Dormibacteraeota bacterium]
MSSANPAEIRVALAGFQGKVGRDLAPALAAEPGFDYVGGIEAGDDLDAFLTQRRPQALVDFTHPGSVLRNALIAVAHRVAPVVGTTGLGTAEVEELEAACERAGLGGIVAPNFAVGAVLMTYLAELAAPFFDGVEIIEMHHQAKADAPSGTALATARRLAARRGTRRFEPARAEKMTLEGVRGGEEEGVTVHSVRLPGLVADQ